MLLIAAALQEELDTALSQCPNPKKIRLQGIEFWRGKREDRTIHFLKTGVGPERAAASIKRGLQLIEASQILVVGYAGALDPGLKLGTLVVVEKALACSIDKKKPAVEKMRLDREHILAPSDILYQEAKRMQLPVVSGNTLTSSHVWGNPKHKQILFEKFHACIVDMETAALAGVSESSHVPLRCLRVVSDEAGDSFLEPFSYEPSAGVQTRMGKLIRKGNPVKAFRHWRRNASVARAGLNRFLAEYL